MTTADSVASAADDEPTGDDRASDEPASHDLANHDRANPDRTHEPLIRIRLDIAYDGTAFSGWAVQPETRTVAGLLEGALTPLTRRHGPVPRLVVAGRTDTGVHAAAQVAHFDLTVRQVDALLAVARRRAREGEMPTIGTVLERRLNGILGSVSDVVVRRAAEAPAGFHARFSALWRRYEYRLADALSDRDPLQRHRTLWLPMTLDERRMDEGAQELLGLHDFASYCRQSPTGTTIRTLQRFGWRRDESGVLIADVVADAFCRSMVRALVGACVTVGESKLEPADTGRLRDARQRSSEFAVAPARGLTLMEIGYPPEGEMAARAELTRGRRTVDGLTDDTDIE